VEAQTPEDYRVAIIGSGGLSHEPRGANAGFIDAEHDQCVLDQVRAGQCTQLADLSNEDLGRCANDELRNWISAIGFIGDTAPDFLEYTVSYRSLVGNGSAWKRM
jgi:hypothetical protein